MLRFALLTLGFISAVFASVAESKGAAFTFSEQWDVRVDDGILDARLVLNESEYVGIYTVHEKSFSRKEYEEALISSEENERVEKIVRDKFSDAYTDVTLIAFRKREVDGRDIIELAFKGASKRVIAPVFIKLSSVSQGNGKSIEVLSMHNMEKTQVHC